jgi:hypothetical protein
VDSWFTLGVRCSLALLPVAVYIVIRSAVSTWLTGGDTGDTKPSLVLEPLVSQLMLTLSLQASAVILKNLLLPSSGLNFSLLFRRWRHQVPLEFWHFSTRLHDIMFQKL